MAWYSNLIDMPMGLGDHLHELRRRLVWPLVTIGLVSVLAFAYQDRLKLAMLWPLKRAVQLAGEKTAIQVGMVHDHAEFAGIMDHEQRWLHTLSVAESTNTAVKVSMAAGIAIGLPVLLWHLWQFVAVGLTAKERRLAFLFLPLGVILFYIGAVVGYFLGLPYFYCWLIQFTANDSTATYELRQSTYVDDFVNWTISFGLIMDIPWLVMVLVRTGLVTPAAISKARKFVFLGNVILTCCLCPATDFFSLLAMFLPIQVLFEVGLLASRFLVPVKAVPAVTDHGGPDHLG
jgi:sec-independent protein translocase protein TatC